MAQNRGVKDGHPPYCQVYGNLYYCQKLKFAVSLNFWAHNWMLTVKIGIKKKLVRCHHPEFFNRRIVAYHGRRNRECRDNFQWVWTYERKRMKIKSMIQIRSKMIGAFTLEKQYWINSLEVRTRFTDLTNTWDKAHISAAAFSARAKRVQLSNH